MEDYDSFDEDDMEEEEFENYKIIQKLKQKDLFLVSKKDNKSKNQTNFLLKKKILKNEMEKYEILKKLTKFEFDYFEKNKCNKTILYILMEAKNCKYLKEIDEITVDEEKVAWKIFIRFVMELKALMKKNIQFNINPNLIYIDNKNDVKINLIDLVLFTELKPTEKIKYENKSKNMPENIDINLDDDNDMIIINNKTDKKFNDSKKKELIHKQKQLTLFLGIFLLDLLSKEKLLKYFSAEKNFFNDYFNQIIQKINSINIEEFKIFLSRLLCNEEKRIVFDELFLEKIFLRKVVEFGYFNEFITNEKNSYIDFNSFPLSFSCNSCNSIPNISFLDDLNLLFQCSKCRVFDKEKIDDIMKMNSNWTRFMKNKILNDDEFKEFHDASNCYNDLLNNKIEYINENINYIQTFQIPNNGAQNIYYEIISNILQIFFKNINIYKNKLLLIIMLINSNYNKHTDNIISYKNFFSQKNENGDENMDKNKKIQIKKKEEKDDIIRCMNVKKDFLFNKEGNIDTSSFVDNKFNSLIAEQRDNFVIFLKGFSKDVIHNYISNTFSNRYMKENNDLQKKKNYIENTIDFSRNLHNYIHLEKRNNPDNFIDIRKTLEDFDEYSEILNSKKHTYFILALLGKFLEENGTKVSILKEKDKNFDGIELSSLQALFSLGTQRKYYIHFKLGESKTYEILNNKSEQKKFIALYKQKISNLLKIDINRIIFNDIKFGCTQVTCSIVDQSTTEDREISRLREIEDVIEIEKRVIIDEQILSPDILDPKGDRHDRWGINESRGGEKYIPPLDGWVGIGLKVWDKYENNKWLGYKNLEGEYSIAYYGLYNYLDDKDEMSKDLKNFVTDIRSSISERVFQTEDDQRTGFLWFHRKKCGGGICLFQDPKLAEYCAGIINIFGIEYKILLMCRVKPQKIRQPLNHNKFWILNPTPDEIRPYRILLKKVNNSPLIDCKLKVDITPVNFIMDAINSNDFSFYELKMTDVRFNKKIYKDKNNNYLTNEVFILKFYSSMYYKPLNTYMFKEEVLPVFKDSYGNDRKGFTQNQLNSAIHCLQYVIKNYNSKKSKKIENGTIVYRGMSLKFPQNISVGSHFYFSSFVSTSTSRSVAHRFRKSRLKETKDGKGTFMTITIQNNGTDQNHPNYCLNIESSSLSPKQKEILICSHCYFQVTSMNRSSGIDYVDLVCKGYLLDNYN